MLVFHIITIVTLLLKNINSLNLSFIRISSSISNTRYVNTKPLFAEGGGFGKPSNNKQDDDDYRPYYDTNEIIDNKEAMSQFFTNYEEWTPLFLSLICSSKAPALSFLGEDISFGQNIDFSDLSAPWKQLEGIPKEEDKLSVISEILDAVQKSWLDIPVNEAVEEDAADVRFVEEGRRLLVLSRFHILFSNNKQKRSSKIDKYDELFTTCWSEIAELHRANEIDTASLIVLPNTLELSDIRRFADMNIHKPLTWLGIDSDFEVETLNSAYPAIRIIHKLSDIPVVEPVVETCS